MDENLNYETYIFVGQKKLIIFVSDNFDKKVFEEKIDFENHQLSNLYILNKLDYFLNENILKIEKKINNFIKKISIILDLDEFFPIEISLKKNNYENIINLKSLTHLLYEAKNYCKKTINQKKILHITINNYQVDSKNYPFLPEEINYKSFSIDIEFLCVSHEVIKNLEQILKRYQISLEKVVSAPYIKKFLTDDEKDIFLMTKKIIAGHNPNEVKLAEKTIKNKGFFEKFFNLFN